MSRLPNGLSLGRDGKIRGTTREQGRTNVLVNVRDATGRISGAAFSITVLPEVLSLRSVRNFLGQLELLRDDELSDILLMPDMRDRQRTPMWAQIQALMVLEDTRKNWEWALTETADIQTLREIQELLGPLEGIYKFLKSAAISLVVPGGGIPGIIGSMLKIDKLVSTLNTIQDMRNLIDRLGNLPRRDFNIFIAQIGEDATTNAVFDWNWYVYFLPRGMTEGDARKLAYYIFNILRTDADAEKRQLRTRIVDLASEQKQIQTPSVINIIGTFDDGLPALVIRWTAVEGAERYQIYRNSLRLYTTRSAGSFLDSGLVSGRSYTYQVRVVGSSSQSELSMLKRAAAPTGPAPERKGNRVIVEQVPVALDVAPVIEAGHTLVPVRAIAEALGAVVGWNESRRSSTLTLDRTTVELQIGKTTAWVNGRQVTLTVPAQIRDGRTLVPLRFVSEAFGAPVEWDNNTRSVVVGSPQSLPATELAKELVPDTQQPPIAPVSPPAVSADRPISGANVILRGDNQILETGVSDQDGYFGVSNIVANSNTTLEVQANGFVSSKVAKLAIRPGVEESIVVSLDQAYGNIRFRIRDEMTGAPVPEATVVMESDNGSHFGVTGSSGLFEVNNVRATSIMTVSAKHQRYITRIVRGAAAIVGGVTTEVDLLLSPRLDAINSGHGTVTGMVIDAVTGAPMNGVQVEIRAHEGWNQDVRSTSSDGKFESSQIPARSADEPYRIIVSTPNYHNVDVSGVMISGGRTTNMQIIKLWPIFGTVTGMVIDAVTGAPMNGAQVEIRAHGGWNQDVRSTRSDGKFEFSQIPGRSADEPYRVIVSTPNYHNAEVSGVIVVGGRTTNMLVRLSATTEMRSEVVSAKRGNLSGQIFNAMSGTPFSGAQVIVKYKETVIRVLTTDAGGFFRADRLDVGQSYAVEAVAFGYVTSELTGISIIGDSDSIVNLALSPRFGAISVTVAEREVRVTVEKR